MEKQLQQYERLFNITKQDYTELYKYESKEYGYSLESMMEFARKNKRWTSKEIESDGSEFKNAFLKFLRRMLTVDPAARVTAADALTDPFFQLNFNR